jgi:hypothetical protein
LKSILEGEERLDDCLECFISNKEGGFDKVSFIIRGSVGIRLEGIPLGVKGQGTRLIRHEEARDVEHFWKLWRHYNPDASVEWEEE